MVVLIWISHLFCTFANRNIAVNVDAAQRLRALNSDVKIVPYSCRLTEENAEEIIQQYDIVVDGCDNFETRYLLGEVCMRCHKPYVYGAIQGFNGQVAVFDTDHHPVTYKDLYPEPMAVTPLMKAVVGTTPVIVGSRRNHPAFCRWFGNPASAQASV